MSETAERLLVSGNKVSLYQLTISRGAQLEIERDEDGINLYIYDGIAQGVLGLQDSQVLLQWDHGVRKSYTVFTSVPESLRFTTKNYGASRLRLRIQPQQDWEFNGLQIADIQFQEEKSVGSGNFISSIRKGVIEWVDIKRKKDLVEYDQLHIKIEKMGMERLGLSFPVTKKESFDILFQGRVRAISTGPKNFEQNLLSSFPIWLYHQKIAKVLGVFWGSFVVFYLLLLSIKRILPRQDILKNKLKKNTVRITLLPLRKAPVTRDGRQRFARLFGKRSGISLRKRYPLSWLQWASVAVLVLSLLTASALSIQQWLGAGQGEVRLSVLAEQGGGNGWVGVEESVSSLGKRSDTEGLLRLPVETRLPLRKNWQLVFYDQALQPAYTVELGRISENHLVRLGYEEAEALGETGELVVTDKQRQVLRDAEVTLRSALFTSTARADRTLVLPVGPYEVQVENSKGIGTAWQRIAVQAGKKEVVELELNRFREPLTGMEFIYIPEDCFQMGSPSDEKDRYDDEGPVHTVCVD